MFLDADFDESEYGYEIELLACRKLSRAAEENRSKSVEVNSSWSISVVRFPVLNNTT